MDRLNTKRFVTFNVIYWSIASLGAILRISQYLSNKSLWRDESRLVLNIIERSFIDLSVPLSYEQAAPFGFLSIEKLISIFFGLSEYSFRFFPLICGIASIFLFHKIVNKIFNPVISLVATLLFAISPVFVFYSSEVKPYSSDIFITLLLLSTTLDIELTNPRFKTLLFLFLEGIILVWFSYPVIFTLTSIGVYLFLFLKSGKEKFSTLSPIIIGWLVSILSFYYLSKCALENSISIQKLWESTNIAEFFTFSKIFIWLFRIFTDLFNFTSLDQKMLILLVIGIISLYKRERKICTLFSLPLFLLLVSFVLKLYPPANRLLLFIVPLFIIFIFEAVNLIFNKTWKSFPLITILLTGFILYSPIKDIYLYVKEPPSIEEIKPPLSYIKQHFKKGDLIYLNNHLQYSFKYYAKSYGFNNDFYVFDTKNPYAQKNGLFYKEANYALFIDPDPDTREDCIHLFDKVKGNKRVWVMYSTYVYNPLCELNKTFNYLDTIGIKLNSFNRPGVKLMLYDLQEKVK